MNEIKLYKSRWKAIRLVFICLPFVLLGVWLIISHKSPAIGWLTACFFGISFPLAIFNLIDRRPQIIINETGVYDRSAYKDFINWNIIEHAYWNTSYKQTFVCLIIKEEFKHLFGQKTRLQHLTEALGYEEVNINVSNISKVDHEKLTALIINLSNARPVDRSRMIIQNNTSITDK